MLVRDFTLASVGPPPCMARRGGRIGHDEEKGQVHGMGYTRSIFINLMADTAPDILFAFGHPSGNNSILQSVELARACFSVF